MMCKEVLEQLNDYLDHNLDEKMTVQIENHITTCDGCQNEFKTLSEIMQLMSQLEEHTEYPDNLHQSIMERIPYDQKTTQNDVLIKKSKFRMSYRTLSTIAATVVIVIVLTVIKQLPEVNQQYETPMVSMEVESSSEESVAYDAAMEVAPAAPAEMEAPQTALLKSTEPTEMPMMEDSNSLDAAPGVVESKSLEVIVDEPMLSQSLVTADELNAQTNQEKAKYNEPLDQGNANFRNSETQPNAYKMKWIIAGMSGFLITVIGVIGYIAFGRKK